MGGRALAVAVLLVVGLTLPAAVAPASAANECAPAATPTGAAPVTAEVTVAPDNPSGVAVTYDADGASDLSVSPGKDVEVLDADGFGADGGTYQWDGQTASPSLVYATDPEAELGYESGDGWVLTAIPDHDGTQVEVVPKPTGVVGSEMLLVGEHEIYERSIGCETLQVIVPEGVEPPNPERILDAQATAAETLDVGHRYETVRTFAVSEASEPVYRTGRASGPDLWVREGRPLDEVDNTWIHEYVHTRQDFRLGGRMSWFREASAMYYAARISMDAGLLPEEEYRSGIEAWTRDSSRRETLAEADSLDEVSYYKGGAVLAALDRKIRTASEGRRTLADVFARMNAHDGEVTYGVFKSYVVEVAGERFDEWLDHHVLTDAAPPAPGEESEQVNETVRAERVEARPAVSVASVARG